MGFYLFGTFIPYYGFCIMVGIACALLLGFFICKSLKLNIDDFIIICAYLFVFGFVGAKILYIIISFRAIDFKILLIDPKKINELFSSGFVFYGGLIGGILALLFVRKVHGIHTEDYLGCIVPALGIAHGAGRIGCSLAGCCYGKHTSLPFYFIYHDNPIAPNDIKLFPVQGIEAACVIVLGIICAILVLKKPKVRVHLLYATVYAIIRFVLEFFRGDEARGSLLLLSTSQIISLLLLISVAVITILFSRKPVENKDALSDSN